MTVDLTSVLASLRPNAKWAVRDNIIQWLDETQTQPTEKEIQQELQRLQEEYPKKVVQASRAAAYSQEADPLFFQYQAGEVTKEEWLAKREEIRTRYPYPS